MAKAVDFQKVRKRRQRSLALKRLMMLAGVVALLGLVVLLNSVFIEEGLTTRIGDFIESFGGTGYPVATPGGIIRDIKSVGNNLAVLNDTNLYLYNRKGKQISNVQQMSENSVLLTNANRTLTYQVGGKTYAIHSPSKALLSREEDDNITGAALGENGSYAIVTSPRQYVARVVVYNKQFSEMFRWDSAENMVLDLALSPKGQTMAVTTVNTEGGVIESSLNLFRLSAKAQEQVRFRGELALHVEYLGEDRIGLLTDQAYRVLDSSGSVVGSYNLASEPASKLERSGSNTLLLTDIRETRTHHIVLLDSSCNVVSEMTTDSKIRDMALGTRRIYLLTDQGITAYNYAMEAQEVQEERGISRIHLIGGRLYCFTADEIHLMEDGVSTSKLEEPEEPEEEQDRPQGLATLPQEAEILEEEALDETGEPPEDGEEESAAEESALQSQAPQASTPEESTQEAEEQPEEEPAEPVTPPVEAEDDDGFNDPFV